MQLKTANIITTKKVKENDFKLAYYAAKSGIQIAYLEFYSEEDDIFD